MTKAVLPANYVLVKAFAWYPLVICPSTGAGQLSVADFRAWFRTNIIRRDGSEDGQVLLAEKDELAEQKFKTGEVLILPGVEAPRGEERVRESPKAIWMLAAAAFITGLGVGSWWADRR